MSDREHPFDQLATVSAGSVLNADIADVGRYRERARMQRLWRLSVFVGLPTLFLWGMSDRILTEKYGRGYCSLIEGARFEPIEKAGHFPHIEQPQEFARRALGFANESSAPATRVRRA